LSRTWDEGAEGEGAIRSHLMQKFLIVTADDFGLHPVVNEGIEQASRSGVLTAASLMMGARAVEDAVSRARRLPALRVGLHVVLADGWATLPPAEIPGLVDRDGHMDGHMFERGVRFFAVPRIRRQLEAEIRSQFAAFARTGLRLDHVNAHKHFHLHPTLLSLLIRIGRDYGMAAIRVPHEPLWFAAEHGWGAVAGAALLRPWILLLKARLKRARLKYNDQIFGMAASGAMDETALLKIVARLPPGITEIYCHPATQSGSIVSSSMPAYRHADELAALLSPRVRAALARDSVTLGGYADAEREA
jgi:hopanoid biosynthesis associated protein HpnK